MPPSYLAAPILLYAENPLALNDMRFGVVSPTPSYGRYRPAKGARIALHRAVRHIDLDEMPARTRRVGAEDGIGRIAAHVGQVEIGRGMPYEVFHLERFDRSCRTQGFDDVAFGKPVAADGIRPVPNAAASIPATRATMR